MKKPLQIIYPTSDWFLGAVAPVTQVRSPCPHPLLAFCDGDQLVVAEQVALVGGRYLGSDSGRGSTPFLYIDLYACLADTKKL